LIALIAKGLMGYAQIYYICERGCNAHIVRLADFQPVTKIDPRGVDFRNFLIMRKTNNVCVAPQIIFYLYENYYHDTNSIFMWPDLQRM